MAETLCLISPNSCFVISCFKYKSNHMSVALYRLTHTHLINVIKNIVTGKPGLSSRCLKFLPLGTIFDISTTNFWSQVLYLSLHNKSARATVRAEMYRSAWKVLNSSKFKADGTHRLHNSTNSSPHIVFTFPPTLPHTSSSQFHQLSPTHRLHNSTNSAPHIVFTIPPTLPHTSSSQIHQLCPTHHTQTANGGRLATDGLC